MILEFLLKILTNGEPVIAMSMTHTVREYSADEFVSWTRIMASQLTIQEPYKSKFFEGIRDAILSFGNHITLLDDIVLYMVRKP